MCTAANAQLLCFNGADYRCNGTLIEGINSVSDCCSLSDGHWYIKDANSSLDCITCLSKWFKDYSVVWFMAPGYSCGKPHVYGMV